MEQVETLIVGGGVIGLACAARLAPEHETVLLEKRPFLGEEQSGRNSGVIHAGVYYHPASFKAHMCVLGNHMLYKFCAEHKVPCARVGKYIVATTKEEEKDLLALYRRARRIGAHGVHIVEKFELQAAEPTVSAKIALHFPSTGIIDSASYIKTLARLARLRNAVILNSATVTNLKPHYSGIVVEIQYQNGSTESVLARQLINASGNESASLAKKLNPHLHLSISHIRGEYYSFIAHNDSLRINANIYPTPKRMSIGEEERFVVGIHLTPTFDMSPDGSFKVGNRVLVGPSAQITDNPSDLSPPKLPPEYFVKAIKPFFPSISAEILQPEYTGVQAKLSNFNDFAIFRDPLHPSCIHTIGIDSPGLTSSLAIANYIARLITM